jgi:hypothetical protein
VTGSRSNQAWEEAGGRATSPSSGRTSRRCWRSSSSRPMRSVTRASATTRCSRRSSPACASPSWRPFSTACGRSSSRSSGACSTVRPPTRRSSTGPTRTTASSSSRAACSATSASTSRRAAGQLHAPLLRRPRPHRRAPHHAGLRLARARLSLLDDARGGARALRAGPRHGAPPHVPGPRAVARPARVAEPVLGERRRPLAGLLAALPARRRAMFPGSSTTSGPRRWPAASTRSPRRRSASTPTR